jgi:four helix bundle protein
MAITSYRDLLVWKKVIDLVVEVYAISELLPDKEKFGLISQIRRAASSVPANIAEGHDRDSTKEFIRFISIARGSLAELETHIVVATRLNFLSNDKVKKFWTMSQEIGRMLAGLMRSLKSKLESE